MSKFSAQYVSRSGKILDASVFLCNNLGEACDKAHNYAAKLRKPNGFNPVEHFKVFDSEVSATLFVPEA